MEWHVIIDGNSPLAGKHAESAHGFIPRPAGKDKDGKENPCPPPHILLRCEQIDLTHPVFLKAKLAPSDHGEARAWAMWIPLTHVVGIVESGEAKLPFQGLTPH